MTMFSTIRTAALAGALAALATGAAAGAEEPRRFTMSPSEGGFVRLDTVTGEVSFCSRKGGEWACETMADQGRDVRRDNDRLVEENRQLRAENRRLEETLGLGEPRPGEKGEGERRAERPGPRFELPSEADIDRAMSYVQRMLRKFRDKLKELEGPERQGT
jgi:hypothetical protein